MKLIVQEISKRDRGMIFTLDSYRTPIIIHGKNQLSRVLHYGLVEQCHNGDINLSIVMILFDLNLKLEQMKIFFIKDVFVNSLNPLWPPLTYTQRK